MKILFVVERPTQFEAPFFRYAAGRPEADFQVLFTDPAPGGQVRDPELDRKVAWGFDLLAGYEWSAAPAEGAARWVAREVASRRPDLLIVNGYTRLPYLAAAASARRRGVPAALRTDSVLWPGTARPPLSRRVLYRGPLAATFRLFLTTGGLGRRYLASCGIPPGKIGLFPYAVDVEHFRHGAALTPEERARRRRALGLPESARTILSVAKFGPREAPWDLVRAFGELAGDDLRLVLAGDGPAREELEELAARCGRGRVLFPGYVPYPELPALYGIADLFVHAAAEERWGVSVAEAMAAGLPVVASSRVGAAYDLVRTGDNGFVYPVGEPAALAAALDAALALDPTAVAGTAREVLADHDYRTSWRSLVEAARAAGSVRKWGGRHGSPSASSGASAGPAQVPPAGGRETWIPRLVRRLPPTLRRHRLVALLARIAPSARVALVRFNGTALAAGDLSDPAPRQVLLTGVFEPEFFALARCFVAPSSAVLDVGANYGFCGFGLAASTPPEHQVSFHLFEANPALCDLLRRSARLYPRHRLHVVEGLVSERPGRSRLRVVRGHSGASHAADDGEGPEVEHVMLDEYLRRAGVRHASFVKLDVEGSELRAVRGLAGTIASGGVGALYLEVSGRHLARYGATPADLLDLLRSLDCEILWCKPQDFAAGVAPPPRSVPVAAGGSLPLARVDRFPGDHQTDLLAIPRSGPFGELLRGLEAP